MLLVIATIIVVSSSLIAGAAWGIWGRLGPRGEGFLIAFAGGALVLSSVTELIEPAIETTTLANALAWTVVGAAVFTLVDYLIDERWGSQSGGGLLAAITLDGIPENLALGVALIGATPLQVAALAGSIFLSNLPEAAGGAKGMRGMGWPPRRIFLLWVATAGILVLAALIGNLALEGANPHLLASFRCVAAGAVVASLATEVFPKAYREGRHMVGIATVLGFVLAIALGELAK
jgi:ZIP family zinc transporter